MLIATQRLPLSRPVGGDDLEIPPPGFVARHFHGGHFSGIILFAQLNPGSHITAPAARFQPRLGKEPSGPYTRHTPSCPTILRTASAAVSFLIACAGSYLFCLFANGTRREGIFANGNMASDRRRPLARPASAPTEATTIDGQYLALLALLCPALPNISAPFSSAFRGEQRA